MSYKKEKLVSLIKQANNVSAEELADILISNGVYFVSFKRGDAIDISGMRFGNLVALERNDPPKSKQSTWLCQCDCGKQITVLSQALRIGKRKSCGCAAPLRKNKPDAASNTRLYRAWQQMKYICKNKNHVRYKNYGAKGITVCDEWNNNFRAFRDWATANGFEENAPAVCRSLQRLDDGKDFCPENCFFPTKPKSEV